MENRSPAFQWYPKDHLTDENVIGMTLEEEGAYRRLIDYCWLHGSIPNEFPRMALLCKVGADRMEELWVAIQPCFKEHQNSDNRLIHPRLEKEIEKQQEHREKKVAAGKAGAKKRWKKSGNGTTIADPTQLPLANDGFSSSSSSPSSKSIQESFDEFWTAYPKRKGANPKRPAKQKWEKAIQKIHPQELLALTIRFALRMEAEETIGTPFVPQATTWLNQERWVEEREDPSGGDSDGSVERYISW